MIVYESRESLDSNPKGFGKNSGSKRTGLKILTIVKAVNESLFHKKVAYT